MQPVFYVIANDNSYPGLVTMVHKNGAFDNQMEGGANAGATWSIQFRWYRPAGGNQRAARQTPPCPHQTPAWQA